MQTETKASHTPLPWRNPGNGNIIGADGEFITSVPRPKGVGASVKRDANTAYILRAVNSHADLLAACKAAVNTADSASETGHSESDCIAANWDVIGPMLRAAIAKAEGAAP